MCRRRLYFAGPAPRSETTVASPVAVVIGDIDIVSMVRFTDGRVEEFIHASLPKSTHEWSSFLTPEELVPVRQRASSSNDVSHRIHMLHALMLLASLGLCLIL
ncbi:hypothetical protein Dsin_022530 [Dipteronia sinensis]|uniref:Uncharacterized protein n=1 Tax=Dipteronia sinensis TaxID=43782 RepID=A0AAE0A240_9ROSI|nr:hypothetical protein Dsin_022530 [Dipteronia sinensis]